MQPRLLLKDCLSSLVQAAYQLPVLRDDPKPPPRSGPLRNTFSICLVCVCVCVCVGPERPRNRSHTCMTGALQRLAYFWGGAETQGSKSLFDADCPRPAVIHR